MIEEINPHHFYNQFEPHVPQSNDRIFMLKEDQAAMMTGRDGLDFPRLAELM